MDVRPNAGLHNQLARLFIVLRIVGWNAFKLKSSVVEFSDERLDEPSIRLCIYGHILEKNCQ